MDFEWDEEKSQRNLEDRGFDFAFAARIFEGSTLEVIDDRRAYGEKRVRAIGVVEGHVLTVVYTDREDVRRIISAWPAHRKERLQWQLFGAQPPK